MRKLVLILLFSITVSSVFAQMDFKPGYVITKTNDTIYGIIQFGRPYENSIKCVFKKDEKSEKIVYTVNDIKAYRYIDDKYFISKKIQVDGNDTTLFLEYIIKGKLNIYFRVDNQAYPYYYAEKEDGKFYELKNTKKQIEDASGDRYFQEKKEYLGVLNILTTDCPELKPRIEKTEYNNEALKSIVKQYQERVCNNEKCIVYEKKKEPLAIAVGISFEGNMSNEITIGDFPSYSASSSNNRFNGYVSFNNIPYVSSNFSVILGVSYNNEKILFMNTSSIVTPILIKYSLIKKVLEPTVAFGISPVHRKGGNGYQSFNNYSILFILQAGLKYNITSKASLMVNLNYNYNNISNFYGRVYSDYDVTIKSYWIEIGVMYNLFDKK